MDLNVAASYTDDHENALAWARQAQRIDPARIPGWLARLSSDTLTDALSGAGELTAAQRSCAEGLARARLAGAHWDQAYCLWQMADLEQQTGHISEAGEHLWEALELAARIGDRLRLLDCLELCGHLCAATRRWAEAITVWAAYAARRQDDGILVDLQQNVRRRQEPLRKAEQALGSGRMRAAEDRGAAMTLATAVEFAAMLAAGPQQPQAPPGLGRLSPRERELVALVAQGRTDAQIAGQLYISVSTVRSHLDRIRDKSGCRRRADLTRLALQAGLV